MIFQETLAQVLSGDKTVTRRLIQAGQSVICGALHFAADRPDLYTPWQIHAVWGQSEHTVYRVGSTYAVQPGRGKPSVARIRILSIERDDDVRDISAKEAKREGFDAAADFLDTWIHLHDSATWIHHFDTSQLWEYYVGRGKVVAVDTFAEVLDFLATRPADRYAAWRIEFQLVSEKELA